VPNTNSVQEVTPRPHLLRLLIFWSIWSSSINFDWRDTCSLFLIPLSPSWAWILFPELIEWRLIPKSINFSPVGERRLEGFGSSRWYEARRRGEWMGWGGWSWPLTFLYWFPLIQLRSPGSCVSLIVLCSDGGGMAGETSRTSHPRLVVVAAETGKGDSTKREWKIIKSLPPNLWGGNLHFPNKKELKTPLINWQSLFNQRNGHFVDFTFSHHVNHD